jgi:hypothetical protein
MTSSVNRTTSRWAGNHDYDDVGHALGADPMALGGKQTREGQRGKSQVITVEWDERMHAMSKEGQRLKLTQVSRRAQYPDTINTIHVHLPSLHFFHDVIPGYTNPSPQLYLYQGTRVQ